jgi:hypothetical protein
MYEIVIFLLQLHHMALLTFLDPRPLAADDNRQ